MSRRVPQSTDAGANQKGRPARQKPASGSYRGAQRLTQVSKRKQLAKNVVILLISVICCAAIRSGRWIACEGDDRGVGEIRGRDGVVNGLRGVSRDGFYMPVEPQPSARVHVNLGLARHRGI